MSGLDGLTIPWSFKVECDEGWNDQQFWEDLFYSKLDEKGDPEYGWIEVSIDSPHASFIEYGTERPKETDKKPWKKFVDIIEKWCDVKLNLEDSNPNRTSMKEGAVTRKNKDGEVLTRSKKDVAYAIAYKILNEGIPPQPFFRPALYDTLNKCFDTEGMREEYTISDVGDILSQTIRDYYEMNRPPYGSPIRYGGPYRSKNDKSIGDTIKVSVHTGKRDTPTEQEEEITSSAGMIDL